MTDFAEQQVLVALRFGAVPQLPDPGLKAGVARNVRSGLQPLNAFRHVPEDRTTGWYIWAGENLSDADDFFIPLHVSHLAEWCPAIVPYLGFPPGWRVLIAPGYEDIWFDEALL